jgi:hypothetical protein
VTTGPAFFVSILRKDISLLENDLYLSMCNLSKAQPAIEAQMLKSNYLHRTNIAVLPEKPCDIAILSV